MLPRSRMMFIFTGVRSTMPATTATVTASSRPL
jgi:hypothetical protein